MIATYDLRHRSASFEFFYWLVVAKAYGATKVCVDASQAKTTKLTLPEIKARIDNILVPGCALAGLPVFVEWRRRMETTKFHSIWRFPDWYAAGGKFERLCSVKEPASYPYTITLRNFHKAVNRNCTNEVVWRQFADEIGAFVIDDYSVKPIHLHDRMALYAGARMNFGVCNGPVAFLGLTSYPVCMFVHTQSAQNSQFKSGYVFDQERFPWMLSSQRMVWKEDTFENLMGAVTHAG